MDSYIVYWQDIIKYCNYALHAAYNVKKDVKVERDILWRAKLLEVDRYIEKENPLIIDLRSETDYMKKHIKGAVCINAEDLENAIENYIYGRTGIVRTGDVLLKKNKIILLYCSRGAQSYFMCRKMSMAGFNVKSLAGGIERYKGRYITA